jgi:hypothetical protein
MSRRRPAAVHGSIFAAQTAFVAMRICSRRGEQISLQETSISVLLPEAGTRVRAATFSHVVIGAPLDRGHV